MAIILDGKETAEALRQDLTKRMAALKEKGRVPTLAIILAGESKPSAMYASFMEKVAASYGISVRLCKQGNDATEEELKALIRELNGDKAVTGILMMMPLPKGIDADAVVECIDPDKDIDGLTTTSLGRLAAGKDGLVACTPRAVMAILSHYGIPLKGKHAVVIGRSTVVGKPVSLLLLASHATVTICHSHTENLKEMTKKADILVAAVGKPACVTADMVRPGAVVIDVGINRVNGKTTGDVDYDAVKDVAGAITPVPGGVGSVTTTMVIEALIQTAEKIRNC